MESATLPRERIRHLTAASRHLAAAGYGEMAANVRAEIPKLVAETRRAHGNAAPTPPADAALREEVEKRRTPQQATTQAWTRAAVRANAG